jgi:diguanylate cyclase (GGDEF)-like protein
MQIDPFTVVFAGLLIRSILAVLFLIFWLTDRRSSWFAWWSAAFFLGNFSALFFLTGGFTADYLSIGFGTALLMAAFCCAWQGARGFEGRPPLWLAVFGVPALWLIACLMPGFLESALYRVLLSSALLAWLTGATAVEFWRGREEALPSRWPIVVLFAILAAIFAARIPLVGVAPFPFGALPQQANWVAAFSLVMILHTVALAVLVVAISRERLAREQSHKAQTDLLTGALNRRAFMSYAERQMARHRMAGKPLCLLLLDIDRFKTLNDRFGHSFGDEILTRFVATVRDSIRPNDLLFRIGGDEFCCLLPETSVAQARLVAERIRDRLARGSDRAPGTSVSMAASMGIASTEHFDYALDVLMNEADMAVYAAKEEGRNKIVAAPVDKMSASAIQPSLDID